MLFKQKILESPLIFAFLNSHEINHQLIFKLPLGETPLDSTIVGKENIMLYMHYYDKC